MLLNKVLCHGDKINIMHGSKNVKYTVGTLLGHAATIGLDPIEYYNNALKKNAEISECPFEQYRQTEIREFVWLNLENNVISTVNRQELKRPQLKIGVVVIIEGSKYLIATDNNDNLKFLKINL